MKHCTAVSKIETFSVSIVLIFALFVSSSIQDKSLSLVASGLIIYFMLKELQALKKICVKEHKERAKKEDQNNNEDKAND